MLSRHNRYIPFILVALLLSMLGLYGTLQAVPPAGKPPFDDAVTQRSEMIRELREIKDLIRQQNDLLKESLKKPDVRDKPKR